jgi:hypothetical protein
VYVYWERHRAHIDYARYKELGLPLGAGMVESELLSRVVYAGLTRRSALLVDHP